MSQRLERAMDGRCRVDATKEQLLLERGGPGDEASVRVEHDAVAVEDKLVLAADRVDPYHVRAVVDRALGDHRLTGRALAVVVRRAVDVDQELSSVVRLPRHRPGREPAVLA